MGVQSRSTNQRFPFNPFAFRPPPKTNAAQVKKPINPTAGSKNLATTSKTPTKTNNAAAKPAVYRDVRPPLRTRSARRRVRMAARVTLAQVPALTTLAPRTRRRPRRLRLLPQLTTSRRRILVSRTSWRSA
ncbi:hypothetical protein EXIGLDRAFT_57826 [Exidia glandulosa HHB12029]|uniref:Uncharacterized protein n=1 Tax=Exidia glandulosa HHB12029 TaxID=1314781 RepID=A0A165I644_EXIGL|nr:hypothetical protein EXIGLDRAFT_57826 [Exidia glandulosa HHB12029]